MFNQFIDGFLGAGRERGSQESQEDHKSKKMEAENSESESPVREIPVLVPMRRVRLSVNHVLLSGLGGISRFLLRVLDHDVGTLSLFKEITGLQEDEYQPLLERLVALGLVRGDGLTARGKRIAYILSSLHGRSFSVWMDEAFSHNTIVFSDGKLSVRDVSSCEDIVVMPRDARSPAAYKRMKVSTVLDQHGEVFLSGITGVLLDGDNSRMSDWELELELEEGKDALGYIATSFLPSGLGGDITGRVECLSVAIPHLVVERRASVPGFLVEKNMWKEPIISRLGFSFLQGDLVDSEALDRLTDDSGNLCQFPVPSSDDERKAISVIIDGLQLLDNINDIVRNVDHDFRLRYEVAREPIDKIVERLMNHEGVYGLLRKS